MTIVLNPYLHFNGNAEEALTFYHGVFGGDLRLTRYGEFPNPSVTDEIKDQVMHGVVEAPSLTLMASDSGPMGDPTPGDNVSISLSGDDAASLTKYFEDLSDGGKVTEPLSTKQWGDAFGMLTDRFGIDWLVNITAPQSATA
jgi:PhnB protein